MVYRSKRRKFNDFVRTHNWKYYLLFLIVFVTIVAAVVIIAFKTKTSESTENTTTTPQPSETENVTGEQNINVKGKYLISINTANNIISIYSWDADTENFSSSPVREMPAAFPDNIEEDEYSFSKDDLAKTIWYHAETDGFYRYQSDFGGKFIFHSARYFADGNKNSLDIDSYNSIGSSTSSNGFLLLCSDARWIYENCSYASEIQVIFDESISSDNIKSSIIPIPDGLSWDPTDTADDSPFCQTVLKEFNCTIQYATLPAGVGTEPLFKFVKAYDENGTDVSSYVYTTWTETFVSAGTYVIPFYIADIYGNVLTDTINVTVKEPVEETTEAVEPTKPVEENMEDVKPTEPDTQEESSSDIETQQPTSEISETQDTE